MAHGLGNSVPGQLAPRQESHSGRAWRSKDAWLVVPSKQIRKNLPKWKGSRTKQKPQGHTSAPHLYIHKTVLSQSLEWILELITCKNHPNTTYQHLVLIENNRLVSCNFHVANLKLLIFLCLRESSLPELSPVPILVF